MKVAMIIHSFTGNTMLVAKKLKDFASQEIVEIDLIKIEVENEDPSRNDINMKIIGDYEIKDYDLIIFGFPVRAFSISKVMKTFLNTKIDSLENKKIICFVTQHLPYKFMGGNRAIKQIINICNKKGGEVIDNKIINWSSKQKEIQIEEFIIDTIREAKNEINN